MNHLWHLQSTIPSKSESEPNTDKEYQKIGIKPKPKLTTKATLVTDKKRKPESKNNNLDPKKLQKIRKYHNQLKNSPL
jgi:hypothetical protein